MKYIYLENFQLALVKRSQQLGAAFDIGQIVETFWKSMLNQAKDIHPGPGWLPASPY